MRTHSIASLVSERHGSLRPTVATLVEAADAPANGSLDQPVGRTLELVAELCETLDSQGIRYCHWKSNEAIERSASGENDLDLLVSRPDAQRFEELVKRLGFKDIRLPPWKELPGVAHWYGLDRPSGRLVHIHAHYQLVIGDDMTKNIHLPIEDAYLASAALGSLFQIPAPEFELALFLVRMVLKHCAWDAIAMLQGSLSASERRELVDLTAQVDPDEIWAVIDGHLPFIETSLWERCLRSVRPGSSVWFRVTTARRLGRELAGCRRRPSAVDTYLKIWRRLRSFLRRYAFGRGPIPKPLSAGGALVAIVGGDGAGKTTTVADLSTWLGAELSTRTVHLGKPPRSSLSLIVRGSMGLAARIRRSPTSSATALRSSLAAPDGAARELRTDARLLWEVMTARDRYRAYRRARRWASNGTVVVCDRYPLPEITSMDGAVTAGVPDPSRRGRLIGVLARIERRYYERIGHPDILIILRVEPDLAVQRKRGEERESFVRPRTEEIWRIDWRGTHGTVIDAGRPKAEVLSQIRSLVWSRL